jgi:hypothetical protein
MTPSPACVHHWLVASLAVGGQFAAQCKLCGATQTFPVEPLYSKRAEGGLAAWPRASREMDNG